MPFPAIAALLGRLAPSLMRAAAPGAISGGAWSALTGLLSKDDSRGLPPGVHGPPRPPNEMLEQIKSITKMTLVTWGATKSLETFAGHIVESNRGLAKWNGAIASSFAKLDIRRMQQDIQTSSGTVGSTSMANQAYGDLLETIRPIQQDFVTMMNVAATIASRIGQLLATVTKFLPPMLALRASAAAIEKNTEKDSDAVDPLVKFLDALRKMPFDPNRRAGNPGPLFGEGRGRIPPRHPLPPVK